MANTSIHPRQISYARSLSEHLSRTPEGQRLRLGGAGTASLAAWFLGPAAENQVLLESLLQRTLEAHCEARRAIGDPAYVTEARRNEAFHRAAAAMEQQLDAMLAQLGASVPFFSHRYQAHMLWDLTIPGMVGYFAGMLYNQNNVAAETSPVTAQLEREVGQDLCRMLGFDPFGARPAWGHLTSGGSVANLEGLWAARNLKYYAMAIAAALRESRVLAAARGIRVPRPGGREAPLVELSEWELVNVPARVTLDVVERIQTEHGISNEALSAALDPYLLQTKGIAGFLRDHAPSLPLPVLLGTSSKHYSWPKNAAILGIGKSQFLDVPIDIDARMDVSALRLRLDACLSEKRPILAVAVVLGSTEESAVDPLREVVAMREEYRRAGLDFVIHVDAAWGGYFASLLHAPTPGGDDAGELPSLGDAPAMKLSAYVEEQFRAIRHADSVTIDPHKAGYIPYPAGGLCYRDKRMRDLVAFAASEVFHGGEELDANMGVFGVEGSKPGAAAAAVYLSHQVIRPDRSGYGRILGQALFNSKRFYAAIVTMARPEDPFVVVPVQRIPAERSGLGEEAVRAQLDFLAERIVARENDAIVRDEEAMDLLAHLGSDLIIITYAFNYRGPEGLPNRDPGRANAFNQAIFEAFSLHAGEPPDEKPLLLTTSQFEPRSCGEAFLRSFMRRMGLDDSRPVPIDFLSSTTMSPWLTATAIGNFIPHLIRPLRAKILELAEAFREQDARGDGAGPMGGRT